VVDAEIVVRDRQDGLEVVDVLPPDELPVVAVPADTLFADTLFADTLLGSSTYRRYSTDPSPAVQ
jgi:hypothetical protein